MACFGKELLLQTEAELPAFTFITQMGHINTCIHQQATVEIPNDGILEFENIGQLKDWLVSTVTTIPEYDELGVASLITGVVAMLTIEWNTINDELWFRK